MIAFDPQTADGVLADFVERCEVVRQWASAALHVARVQGRERDFASALFRNAKGVQVAAQAWRQELKNS